MRTTCLPANWDAVERIREAVCALDPSACRLPAAGKSTLFERSHDAVSGFGGANHSNHTQFIDLTSVSFTSGQAHLSYTAAAGSGTLSVVSGATVVAQIKMIGSCTSANFSAKADSDGNVEIVDPMVPNGGSVAPGPARTFPRNGIDLPDIAFGAQTTLADAADAAGAAAC